MAHNRIRAGVLATGLVAWLALGVAPATGKAQTSGSAGRKPAGEATASSATEAGSDYRVGTGDVIQVSVWKEPEASTTVVVRPDGKISIPLVNDLVVNGKTPMEIQEMVAGKLAPFINSPNVTITVREIHSKKVYVLGEVNRNGSFPVVQPTTVLQILTEAGGLRPFAKADSIYVLRTENSRQQRLPFDYKEVVNGRKMEQNIFVQPGDTIVVP